jgi:hypothetical protein
MPTGVVITPINKIRTYKTIRTADVYHYISGVLQLASMTLANGTIFNGFETSVAKIGTWPPQSYAVIDISGNSTGQNSWQKLYVLKSDVVLLPPIVRTQPVYTGMDGMFDINNEHIFL